MNYTTNYEYNQRGQCTKVTHPIDPVTGARYFLAGTYNNDSTVAWTADENHPDAATDPNQRTSYSYDDYKRLWTVTPPIAFAGDTTPRVTYFYYNRDGSATIDYRHTVSAVGNVTTPLGKTVKTVYDNDFWERSVTVGTGAEAATTTYDYDLVGNVRLTKQPNQQPFGNIFTEYFYDKRNRLTDINDAMVLWDRNSLNHTVSWTYDQVGNKKTQLRANDQLTTYDQYDPMNRLQVQSVQRDTAVIDQIVMTYDLAGNLKTFTDGRQKQYIYDYDLLNRRIGTTYPREDNGTVRTEAYHYDLANNMDTFTDRAGAVQTFQYDNRNRQTHFWWNTWPLYTLHERWLTYDPVGNITRVRTEGEDVNDLVYDWRNRRKTDTQTPSGRPSRTVSYTYDGDSNRKTMTYPSGYQLTYGYNSRNQLQSVSDPAGAVVTYDYWPNDVNLNTRTLRNGTASTYTPDTLNRLKSVVHARGGATLGRFDYLYDKVSRIDSVTRDSFRGDRYNYYLDDQLKGAAYDAYNPSNNAFGATNITSLAYDANGNRTSQTNSTSPSYNYSANDLNQYNSVNGAVPDYKAEGGLWHYDGWEYGYNKQNQVTDVLGSASTLYFYYDGLGRQILRYVNGQWIYSAWDGWNLLEEYDISGQVIHIYVHGAATDEMVMRFDPGTNPNRIWYYQDAQGSTTHLTNDAGSVVEKYKYPPADSGRPSIFDANGASIQASAFDNRFLYTGREYYKEGAVYDYRTRFYPPSLGRFLQPDPIGFAGDSSNLYRYCGGDPVNRSDPSGFYGLDPRLYSEDRGGAPDLGTWNYSLGSGSGPASTQGFWSGPSGIPTGVAGGGSGPVLGNRLAGGGGNNGLSSAWQQPTTVTLPRITVQGWDTGYVVTIGTAFPYDGSGPFGFRPGEISLGSSSIQRIINWARTVDSAAQMLGEFVSNTGPQVRVYGPDSPESADLRSDPMLMVKAAEAYASPTGVSSVRVFPFPTGPIGASYHPTRQFVGSYTVEIRNGQAVVLNRTSLWSALGHLNSVAAPDRSETPFGGNTYQAYIIGPYP